MQGALQVVRGSGHGSGQARLGFVGAMWERGVCKTKLMQRRTRGVSEELTAEVAPLSLSSSTSPQALLGTAFAVRTGAGTTGTGARDWRDLARVSHVECDAEGPGTVRGTLAMMSFSKEVCWSCRRKYVGW